MTAVIFIYVDRTPHKPRYTQDNNGIWGTVRGDNYVSVIDANSGKEKQNINLESSPGMIAFRHNDQ